MTVDINKLRDHEQQLDEVLAVYMEARESGTLPDRREWLARYPELAADLEAFFADEEQFDSLVAPLRVLTPAAPNRPELPSTQSLAGTSHPATRIERDVVADRELFGDYELIEEIARGGMGVVYRARQVSLNRTVALKMIRSGQLAFGEEVQRFRREAEAAAQLDHPHIVPIYDIGDQDGHHFFTMKLIEGGSLAQRMAGFRLPNADLRTRKDARGRVWTRAEFGNRQAQIGNFMAAVARAVDYAHQRGLLHRDLKPANILVDDKGQPHITDFGLVKRVAQTSLSLAGSPRGNGKADLTESGIAVGTPNYMAPEQAAPSRKALTTAADVYSLGAILYELLTGRPPFRAETPLETLVQVLEREPDRPRLLSPWVDQDLETICLKCLEKEPARRYPSAAALAQDLERVAAGEPIEARPVGKGERLVRWCRRNPALAVASSLAGLALVTVAGVSLFFAIREAGYVHDLQTKQQELNKKQQETEKERNLARQALANAQRAKKARTRALREARLNLDRAKKQEALAEARFWQAHQAVGDLCIRLGEEKLAAYPGVQPVRKELLEAGLKYYQAFLKQKDNDARVQLEVATTLFRIAFITNVIGSQSEALAIYDQALAMYRKLLHKNPENVAALAGIARTSLNMGILQNALGEPGRALASYQRARDLYARLSRLRPRVLVYRSGLAMSHTNLAGLYRSLGRFPESLRAHQQALAMCQELVRKNPAVASYRSELAVAHGNMGVMYEVQGRDNDALQCYQKALKIQKNLAERNPNDAGIQRDLALSHQRIGNRLCSTGKVTAGLDSLEQGRALLQKLAQANPRVTEYVSRLAGCHMDIGLAFLGQNQADRALASFAEARRLREQVDQRHARVLPARAALASTYHALGRAEALRGQKRLALANFQKARLLLEEVVQTNPENLHYRMDLARTLYRLGQTLANKGRHAEAVEALRFAVTQRWAILERSPEQVNCVRELAWAYLHLGDAEERRGRPHEALHLWDQAQRILEPFAATEPRNGWLQCDLSDTLMRRGCTYHAVHDLDRAQQCINQARFIRAKQVRINTKDPFVRGELGKIFYRLALLHFSKGQRQEEVRYYQKACTVLDGVVRQRPDLFTFRQNLCTVWNNLGVTLAEVGRYADGAGAVRRAIAQQRRNVADFPKEITCKLALAGNYRALAFVFNLERRPAEAMAALEEARKAGAGHAAVLYLIACDLARTATMVGKVNSGLTPIEQAERKKTCDLAMEVLRQAVAAGYRDRSQLDKNPDLAPVRQRDDFKALLAALMK
jgi:serine/threonine-protein kinase